MNIEELLSCIEFETMPLIACISSLISTLVATTTRSRGTWDCLSHRPTYSSVFPCVSARCGTGYLHKCIWGQSGNLSNFIFLLVITTYNVLHVWCLLIWELYMLALLAAQFINYTHCSSFFDQFSIVVVSYISAASKKLTPSSRAMLSCWHASSKVFCSPYVIVPEIKSLNQEYSKP